MKLNRKRKTAIAGSLAVVFLMLGTLVYFNPSLWIDEAFSHEIQEHNNSFLDIIMIAVSWFGYMPVPIVMVAGAALLFYLFKYKTEALFVLFTSLSGVISSVVKVLVNRPRPNSLLVRVVGTNVQQSFPSGHVVFYVIFFGFIAFLVMSIKNVNRPVRFIVSSICFILIAGVSVSRIYLGAHWFTDVLGGYLLGTLCLLILCAQYLKTQQKQAGV